MYGLGMSKKSTTPKEPDNVDAVVVLHKGGVEDKALLDALEQGKVPYTTELVAVPGDSTNPAGYFQERVKILMRNDAGKDVERVLDDNDAVLVLGGTEREKPVVVVWKTKPSQN